MSEHKIPDDLTGRYIELTLWDKGPPNGMQMPWQCSLREEAALIERIAKAEAERDELERKGKDLCCAYGNALITIADLKRDFARPVSMKEMPVGAEFSQVKVNALLAARAAGKGEAI